MLTFAFKTAPVARKFSWDSPFELCFECNCDVTPVLFFAGKSAWGSILAVGMPFVSARAKMTHQEQLRRWYCVTIFVLVG